MNIDLQPELEKTFWASLLTDDPARRDLASAALSQYFLSRIQKVEIQEFNEVPGSTVWSIDVTVITTRQQLIEFARQNSLDLGDIQELNESAKFLKFDLED